MDQKVTFLKYSFAAFINLFIVFSGSAQIPSNSFYHSRETVLPYATLSVLYPDGSQNAIPFTPVIVDHFPAGLADFSNDLDIRGRMIFAGNGIITPGRVYNAYGDVNFQGRIALIVYNYPYDYKLQFGEASDLHIRLYEAALRGASAVILFGMPNNPGWYEPFIALPQTIPKISIPVFSISFPEAQTLLRESGYAIDAGGIGIERLLTVSPVELPLTARLRIKSSFQPIQSEHFKKLYLPGVLTKEQMVYFTEQEEQALKFVQDFLQIPEIEPPEQEVLYFPDFTSLRFFTGISRDEYDNFKNIYNVFSLQSHYNHPIQNEFFHIVNAMTHNIIGSAWGPALPNLIAGTGIMVGHFATDGPGTDIDALTAERFMSSQTALLSRIIEDNGVSDSDNDALALVTGSFLKFLFTSYSKEKFKKLYTGMTGMRTPAERLTVFSDVYLKELKSLQREWVEMLAFGYKIPPVLVDEYLLESERIIDAFQR